MILSVGLADLRPRLSGYQPGMISPSLKKKKRFGSSLRNSLRALRNAIAPVGSKLDTIYRNFGNRLKILAARERDPYFLRDVFLSQIKKDNWRNEVVRLSVPFDRTDARPKRFIILALAHLGDFLLTMRAIQRLRESFPDSHLTLVCAPWCVGWARGSGLVDEVVAFDFYSKLNRDWKGPTREIYDSITTLGLGSYDIAIDFRHDVDTRPCLYRIDAKFRAGYASPIEDGMPHLDLMLPAVEHAVIPASPHTFSLHAEARLQLLANAVVDAFTDISNPVARLAKAGFSSDQHCAILVLSAGDPIRYWPLDSFEQVGRQLIDRGFDIQIIGGEAEEDLVAELERRLPESRATARMNIELDELPNVIAAAGLVIGNGTGVTHLSAMLGVPTITLLTGVSPLSVWQPIGPRTITLTQLMPCSPCGLRQIDECPHGVICQRSITPKHVMEAIDDLLFTP